MPEDLECIYVVQWISREAVVEVFAEVGVTLPDDFTRADIDAVDREVASEAFWAALDRVSMEEHATLEDAVAFVETNHALDFEDDMIIVCRSSAFDGLDNRTIGTWNGQSVVVRWST